MTKPIVMDNTPRLIASARPAASATLARMGLAAAFLCFVSILSMFLAVHRSR